MGSGLDLSGFDSEETITATIAELLKGGCLAAFHED
jgi:hypothetical protein